MKVADHRLPMIINDPEFVDKGALAAIGIGRYMTCYLSPRRHCPQPPATRRQGAKCGTASKSQRRIYRVFRYSISAIFSASLRLLPYSCPAFEFPGRRLSKVNEPAKGLPASTPTWTGSSSQLPR